MPPLISLSVVFALRKFSRSAATGKEHHWLVHLSVNKQNQVPFWFNKNNLISCLLNKKAAFLLIKQQIPSHLVVNKLCSSEWHHRCVHTHNAFKCIFSIPCKHRSRSFVRGWSTEKNKFIGKIVASLGAKFP